MPRAARGRATRSTRSPATFAVDGHLIETYNHIDDLPQLSSLPKKRPRHATRGATAAERRADRQAAAATDPFPNAIVTRSSRQNLLRSSNSTSPVTAPSPSSDHPESEQPLISCRVCLKSTTPTKIICCSICRKGIHTFCLNPPIMDLPDDASWKCIKCRRAHIPLKKEARIILRDALNSYSTLCTDKYINAVANVVCVVSDTESADHKKTSRAPAEPNGLVEPSTSGRPIDNTVILRVSTDDSDLDSDVEDDIQPNPTANPSKIKPSHSIERSDGSNQLDRDARRSERLKASVPSRKRLSKQEPLSSSPSSLDAEEEHPVPQHMGSGAEKRHRHSKTFKSRSTDPALASPRLRLKAKKRRREELNDDSPFASADPKPPRGPVKMPPKRRGRKPATTKMEIETVDIAKQVGEHQDKATAVHKRREARKVESHDRNETRSTPTTASPTSEEYNRDSNQEGVEDSRARRSADEDRKGINADANISNGSTINVEEGYPGDTEDDLPLSIRSARHRKLLTAKNTSESQDIAVQRHGEETESKGNQIQAHQELTRGEDRTKEAKKEPVVMEPTEDHSSKRIESPSSAMSRPAVSSHYTTDRSPQSNLEVARKTTEKWARERVDPKHEALFALAKVQRERSKPGDSSGRLATSLDGESSARFSKLVSRTRNVPESERHRIQVTALAASNMRRDVSNMASSMAVLRPDPLRSSKGSINLLLQENPSEVQGTMTHSGSYGKHQDNDQSGTGRENHMNRDTLPTDNKASHLPGRSDSSVHHRTYPPSPHPERKESVPSTSIAPYASQAIGSSTKSYAELPQQKPAWPGVLRSLEPEAQPYNKQNLNLDLKPPAKKQRSNKFDLHNVLSNADAISMGQGNIYGTDSSAGRYREEDRHRANKSTVRHVAIQNRPSSSSNPYSFSQPPAHPSYESSVTPANAQKSGPFERERLRASQGPLSYTGEVRLPSAHLSGGLSHLGYARANPSSQLEPARHMPSERNRQDQLTPSHTTARREHGLDYPAATSPQIYSRSNSVGEPRGAGLRWDDTRNTGAAGWRRSYENPGAPHLPSTPSQVEHMSTAPENMYVTQANRFIPIDRRTRRPMPYVPTATRKAQFEQGRALAFIDSRPTASNADPSEPYRAEDGGSRMTPRLYSARQEGPYPSTAEHSYEPASHNRPLHPTSENQMPATYYRGDHNPYRREYGSASVGHRADERETFLRDPRSGTFERERVGSDTKIVATGTYGQPRSSLQPSGHTTSRGPVEPPIGGRLSLPGDRREPPSFGSLINARTSSYREIEPKGFANIREGNRRLPEQHQEPTSRADQNRCGYGSGGLESSPRRGRELLDRPYMPYRSDGTRKEASRPTIATITDARIPMPGHADPSHYRSRDTISDHPHRSFGGNLMNHSRIAGSFDQVSMVRNTNHSYTRDNVEAGRSMVGHKAPNSGSRNDNYGSDGVSNIPLVARFDNSVNSYIGGTAGSRTCENAVTERTVNQPREQREQLPSLRSNPSLRDLLS